MEWSEEVRGMREDASKVIEAYKAAVEEGDYLLVSIYLITLPFMALGFVVGEFIGRVVMYLIWGIFQLFGS